MNERANGFRGEFLWEWDIAESQLLQLANAFHPNEYSWRPDPTARSISEVFVHVSCGTFMLLEVLGTRVPDDLYPQLPELPTDHFWAIVRRNDEMEHRLVGKEEVVSLLRRALTSARETITRMDDSFLDHELSFFNESTTIRRVCLRLLAHTHEHMGQLIGYMRARGRPVPWHDWRPDRR